MKRLRTTTKASDVVAKTPNDGAGVMVELESVEPADVFTIEVGLAPQLMDG